MMASAWDIDPESFKTHLLSAQKRPCPANGWCACTGYCHYTPEEWNRRQNREWNARPICSCRCHEHPEAYTNRDCLLCGHRNPYLCEVEQWN